MKRVDCHFMLSGEVRRGYLVKFNELTAIVRPYSKWPQCVALNSLQTKDIKRHLTKHNVTVNLVHWHLPSLLKMIEDVEAYYAR